MGCDGSTVFIKNWTYSASKTCSAFIVFLFFWLHTSFASELIRWMNSVQQLRISSRLSFATLIDGTWKIERKKTIKLCIVLEVSAILPIPWWFYWYWPLAMLIHRPLDYLKVAIRRGDHRSFWEIRFFAQFYNNKQKNFTRGKQQSQPLNEY